MLYAIALQTSTHPDVRTHSIVSVEFPSCVTVFISHLGHLLSSLLLAISWPVSQVHGRSSLAEVGAGLRYSAVIGSNGCSNSSVHKCNFSKFSANCLRQARCYLSRVSSIDVFSSRVAGGCCRFIGSWSCRVLSRVSSVVFITRCDRRTGPPELSFPVAAALPPAGRLLASWPDSGFHRRHAW